jgi:beta-N-acetylhexosaminidase
MAACGKHFPGHGAVRADSHLAVPVDRRSRKAILADDALPYRWLSSALPAVMPAHVVYPRVDSRPAGYSRIWLQDILREQLGFTGAVFSDDLSMEGGRFLEGRMLSPSQAAVVALSAGCDLVLLCNQSLVDGGAALDALLGGLQQAQADGAWTADALGESRRLAMLPSNQPLPWDELMHHAPYLQALERLAS